MSQAIMKLTRFAPINFSLSASLLFHTLFVLLLTRTFLLETTTPPIKPPQTKVHILPKKMPPAIARQPIQETQIEKPVQITPVKPQSAITPSTKASLKESTSIATFPMPPVQVRVASTPDIPARATFVKSSSVVTTFDAVAKPHPAQAVATTPRQYGKRSMVQSATLASFPNGVSIAKPQFATAPSGVARRATRIKLPTSVQAFAHSPSKPRIVTASSLSTTSQVGSTVVHSEATAFLSHQDLLPRSQTQWTDKGVLQGYLQILQKDIAAAKSYPERERQAQHEGRVKVAFTLLKSGKIENLRLKEKSQYENLDQAALEAINSVSPFSSFPPEIIEDAIDVVIPFRFELK
jgi:TonB family protein